MGTPDFSCPTLEKLIKDDHFEIVAVYTRQPQIAGRGHKVTNSPIHQLALQHGLKVVTPKTLRSEEAQNEFKNLKADAAVVVAYGLILPKEILQGTKYGCINIHPSLLPRWRGAAPIQRTLMAGDTKTGMTIIQMDEGVDSGDMLIQESFLLTQDDHYDNIAPKLSQMGADLLVKALYQIEQGTQHVTKQDNSLSTYAKKLDKEECHINWNDKAVTINNKIRGLSGSLGAYFIYRDQKIKILRADVTSHHYDQAGIIVNNNFEISCQEGSILPQIIQKPGKKPMSVKDFLLGFKYDVGDPLSYKQILRECLLGNINPSR